MAPRTRMKRTYYMPVETLATMLRLKSDYLQATGEDYELSELIAAGIRCLDERNKPGKKMIRIERTKEGLRA